MITVNTISKEIEYRYARENVPGRYVNGEMTYWHKGEWISREAFERLYPIAIYRRPNRKGENVCRKHHYVNDIKSY